MNKQQELQVSYLAVADVRPFASNARTHPKRQVEQIAASITAFGFTNPILVDPERNIIAGHGRLLGAKKLGLDKVPVITLHSLSEAQQRALRIADNKIALNASWDTDLLRVELQTLVISDVDVGALGFASGEIDVILSGSADPDDELIPDLPQTAFTQPGDIWILGDHRIGCGDCRDADFLRAVVGGGPQVGAAFLDPPYNVRIQGHANLKSRHREFAMASGEMTDADFRRFLAETLGACATVSRDGADAATDCAAPRYLKLLKDVVDVVLDGRRADPKLDRDLLVRHPVGDEFGNLTLTTGERRRRSGARPRERRHALTEQRRQPRRAKHLASERAFDGQR